MTTKGLELFASRLSTDGKMKFHTEYITVHTKTKPAYARITPKVEAAFEKSRIKDGMILVSAMHITAGA